MTRRGAILYSLAVAIFVGGLTAFGTKYFFPDWASDNQMLIVITMGAILGPVYICFIKWGRSH